MQSDCVLELSRKGSWGLEEGWRKSVFAQDHSETAPTGPAAGLPSPASLLPPGLSAVLEDGEVSPV